MVCWKQGWSGTPQELFAEPSHVMSRRHVERLNMWPEIAGMIRASDAGADMEERIALADDWIASFGPGPYELDQRQDLSMEVLGWSSLYDLSGGEQGGSWNHPVESSWRTRSRLLGATWWECQG